MMSTSSVGSFSKSIVVALAGSGRMVLVSWGCWSVVSLVGLEVVNNRASSSARRLPLLLTRRVG